MSVVLYFFAVTIQLYLEILEKMIVASYFILLYLCTFRKVYLMLIIAIHLPSDTLLACLCS